MQFKEIIAVYSENHTKPINALCKPIYIVTLGFKVLKVQGRRPELHRLVYSPMYK
jgi:hypothetical protein